MNQSFDCIKTITDRTIKLRKNTFLNSEKSVLIKPCNILCTLKKFNAFYHIIGSLLLTRFRMMLYSF